MAYIMFLNPFILSGEFAGPEKGFFDFGAVYTATILATALACFIMAFHGKTWPIGLAPGMGINAFVAFGVCAGMGYTPQQALGAVLVAGVLFLIISLTPIRAWLINSIPKSLKLGIGAGVNLVIAHIEAIENPKTLISDLHSAGVQAGLVLNPYTDPALVLPDLITSFDLSVIRMYPFLSIVATSPVLNQLSLSTANSSILRYLLTTAAPLQ